LRRLANGHAGRRKGWAADCGRLQPTRPTVRIHKPRRTSGNGRARPQTQPARGV
jgi:hypothetical protein